MRQPGTVSLMNALRWASTFWLDEWARRCMKAAPDSSKGWWALLLAALLVAENVISVLEGCFIAVVLMLAGPLGGPVAGVLWAGREVRDAWRYRNPWAR